MQMKVDSCPYCSGVVSFDVRDNGVGYAWLVVSCQRCGFAVSIPLNAPKPATREKQWKAASDIWKRMGTLFRNYRTPDEDEWWQKRLCGNRAGRDLNPHTHQ